MKDISCIFCDIPSSDVVIRENGYTGRKCPSCGLIYVSPRPSLDEIIDLYGHNEAHVSAQSHITADFSKRLYARHHLRLLRRFIAQGDMLEIGAGAGHFLDEARKVGFAPHALEFNPVQAAYMRQELRIPCEESPVAPTIFQGRKFDVVYHCDVISHFYDPIPEFNRINEVMRDGAIMLFETGNLGETDQRYFRYFSRFQYPDHLFFFGVSNLVELLERTGFEFVAIRRYSTLPQMFALNLKAALRGNRKRDASTAGSSPAPDSLARKAPQVPSPLRKALRNALDYTIYNLRYRIGRIAPKAGRPQTVLVVARKKARPGMAASG